MTPRLLHIPLFLLFFLVLIAVVNGFADFYHWYWIYRWLDMPMHFAGGMWLSGFAVWWWYNVRRAPRGQSFWSILSICLIFTMGVGLLWEAYEALIGILTVGHMNAVPDTLSDLLFDILGGTTVAIFTWLRLRNKK